MILKKINNYPYHEIHSLPELAHWSRPILISCYHYLIELFKTILKYLSRQTQSKFEQLLCFHCVDVHLAQQTPRKIIKVSHLRVTEIVRIEILKIVPCDNEK